ncbi:MAG: hypothetical protein IKB88_04330 [Clostridia bacterium]|nr:hypothetical protein [Clostridia bacterium]
MAIVLSKIFAGLMSVIVTISGMFPVLFGGKEFIDPNGDEVRVVSSIAYNNIDEAAVITDFETFNKLFGVEENGELNKKFFEESNLAVIPVTLTNSVCEVFVETVSVKDNKVTVSYSVVTDGCFGAAVMSEETILIAVGKNVEKVTAYGKNLAVPFCVHKSAFSFDV